MLKKPPSVIMKPTVKDRLKKVEREFNEKEHKIQKYDKNIISDFIKKKKPNKNKKVVPYKDPFAYIPGNDERHDEFYSDIVDADVDYESDNSNDKKMFLNKRHKKLTKPDNNVDNKNARTIEEIQKMLDDLPPSPFKEDLIRRSSSKDKMVKGGKTKRKKRKNKNRKTCKQK